MERVRQWFNKGKQDHPYIENVELPVKECQRSENEVTPSQVEVDPKVAEYFKYFPEPYKTKAITRFNSRDGLYSWDVFRDLAMKKELQSAMRGVFLEDNREYLENIKMEEEEKLKELENEMKEKRKTREIPNWEKVLRTKIPVHESETLGLKLFQTTNCAVLGAMVVWWSVTLKKRKPQISTLARYTTIAASLYLGGYFQTAAVYRIMDWGPFDRSIDDRDALTKQIENAKKLFISSLSQNKFKERDES